MALPRVDELRLDQRQPPEQDWITGLGAPEEMLSVSRITYPRK
jgi:hypothetical protein